LNAIEEGRKKKTRKGLFGACSMTQRKKGEKEEGWLQQEGFFYPLLLRFVHCRCMHNYVAVV
jgi:hypothetical protein